MVPAGILATNPSLKNSEASIGEAELVKTSVRVANLGPAAGIIVCDEIIASDEFFDEAETNKPFEAASCWGLSSKKRKFCAAPVSGLITNVSPVEASPEMRSINPGPAIWRAPLRGAFRSLPVTVQISSSAE